MGLTHNMEVAGSEGSSSKSSKLMVIVAGVILVSILISISILILLSTQVLPKHEAQSKITIEVSHYGKTAAGEDVEKYLLRNQNGMEVEFLTFGGTITAIRVPDKNGKMDDVSLGYKDLKATATMSGYLGKLVGRVANRIGNGSFTLDGKSYQLAKNNGENHLHGGPDGWSYAVWKAAVKEDHVALSHLSADGDGGYPGEVSVTVTIQLTSQNELIVNYTAQARKKATPINLTYHPYFNLAGHKSGKIYDHKVTLYADRYTPVSAALIPTGELAPVEGTVFDLRQGQLLGDVVHNVTGGGYDHNYCIRGPTGKRLTARVEHAESGRVMTVYTNQPGVQFYTGNFLNYDTGTKEDATYTKHDGFCLETQNYPDAINQPNFPDSVLRPGSIYNHQVWYQFSTE